MPSQHFTDIKITRLTNEGACMANGGSWCVEYKRDGVAKSNGFHTAAVATTFAAQLEAGWLDDETLLREPVSQTVILRQALETIATMPNAPAVIAQIARNALVKAVAV